MEKRKCIKMEDNYLKFKNSAHHSNTLSKSEIICLTLFSMVILLNWELIIKASHISIIKNAPKKLSFMMENRRSLTNSKILDPRRELTKINHNLLILGFTPLMKIEMLRKNSHKKITDMEDIRKDMRTSILIGIINHQTCKRISQI